MKAVIALVVLSAIILGLAFWFVWPKPAVENRVRTMAFATKSSPLPQVIDPPFGFHWGDSMANVEALLGYSAAEIVTRTTTGPNETWIVEGLIQPGLKNAQFTFEKNLLTGVDLQIQYDEWTLDHYRKRIEELRAFFDNRFGEEARREPFPLNRNQRQIGKPFGYSWRLGETEVTAVCRSDVSPPGKWLSVADLLIRYRRNAKASAADFDLQQAERWNENIISTAISPKYQPPGNNPPSGADLALTSAKLLNTSVRNQSALALQLAVKLQPDSEVDPTKVAVRVSFYDALPSSEIILTNAEVSYDWPSQRDWKQNNPENLTVSYVRNGANPESGPTTPSASASSVNKDAAPKYFGYVATVYNDGELECVRADPVALINLFPVRTFISPFENAQTAAARGDFVTAANLYRRSAERGNLFALENLAWFYAHGKGVETDYRQAAIYYERASLQNTPRALNAVAWFLATCEDETIRNGTEAVRHATKACELSYWQEWKYIDTLAAAWAENQDFKRAIEYEQQALALTGIDDPARKKMEDRLALFQKRQPFRE